MNLKDMITDGTIVEFRDGRLAIVLSDIDPENDHNIYTFYGVSTLSTGNSNLINNHGIITLDNYDDNLQSGIDNSFLSKYDIMAIAKDRFYYKTVIRAIFGFLSEKDILWDWRREEVKEVTMAEVEEKIGCKVKIVKEEK